MADVASRILEDGRRRMEKALEVLLEDFRAIRTGRATPALVEGIRVDYYGSPTPLNQIAQISVPEPRGIVIKPFDPGSIGEIEKAILKSDLGITPQNDGKLIRLNFPPLSEEQRKKLAARVKEMAEAAKVSLRNVRRDLNKSADAAEKDKEVPLTEDQARKLRDDIQEMLKKYEKKIEEAAKKKQAEILE